jgi:predicted permease
MIKDYFKIARRNLLRHKEYAIINVSGLAVGIAVCLVIFIVIQFERSFDNFHKKKDRIYRVLTEYHHADAQDVFYGKGVPRAVPAELKASFPQAEKVSVVYTEGNDQMLVLDNNGQTEKKFKEKKGVFFAEPSFFDIFDYKWLSGNAASLKDPNAIVLVKETAEKYFGNWESAIGRNIKWNNNSVLKVTGILATVPYNTDLPLKAVISYGTGYTSRFVTSTDWDGTSTSFGCYVLLAPGVSAATFNNQLRAVAKKMKSPENHDSQIIQPLSKQHFDTSAGTYSDMSVNPELIKGLWLIAAFILLIACVNFVNLTTAQAVNRSKEVSVRKVLGSNIWQLKLQFFAETGLIVLTASLFAVGIASIVLPIVSKITGLHLSLDIFHNTAILLFLLIVAIAVTAVAGFYPSMVLSRFNPVHALKSKLAASATRGISLRRGLVVFQFVIAQALIIGTLIMIRQMNYFTNRETGFQKEAIVNVPFQSDSAGISKLDYVKKELAGLPGISHVSMESNTPMEDNTDNWTTFRFNHAAKETDFYAITKFTDHEYIPTYQIPLVAGRNLEPSDTIKEFLVNEALVKSLGISNPHDILNKEISMWGDRFKGNVVGIVKDFNTRPFKDGIPPLLVSSLKNGYNEAAIKLSAKDAMATIASIEKIWSKAFPDFVFEYKFLDEKIETFYSKEQKLSDLYKVFAIIAIFLSCLGLYGLASFMAVQRIKEVGIRKVLGASAGHIVYLFSREFIILIAIAFAIASPIAWYFMHNWLQKYVYRIDIGWLIFIVGGMASVFIALATVSFQAIKAAVANPVKSLRTE